MSASTRITKAELARQLDDARHTIAELKLDRKILHEEIAALRGARAKAVSPAPTTPAILRGFDVVVNGIARYTAFSFNEAHRICRATKLGSPHVRVGVERVVA